MGGRVSRVAIAFAALLAGAGCVGPRASVQLPAASPIDMPETLRIRTGSSVVTVPFEEYVLGSVLAEVSPVAETADTAARVFAVQAILARTYALAHLGRHRGEGFDLCDTTHCQLYDPGRLRTSRFAGVARQAVANSRSVVLVYNGRAADAVYHADCGGHTASADKVWGGSPVDYLSGASDEVPAAGHRSWAYSVSTAKLRAALDSDPRTRTGGAFDRLGVTVRDESGRAQEIEVHGRRTISVRADTLRAILTRAFGERSILSTRFTIARRARDVEFSGTGYGHGVGLCQVGAAARARRGSSPEMILAAYFPGTSINALGTRRRASYPSPTPFPGLIRSP